MMLVAQGAYFKGEAAAVCDGASVLVSALVHRLLQAARQWSQA